MHRFALKCEQPGGVYFAYGSLVNPATWPTDFDADPAVLHGWLRSWSHCIETESGKVCALAIVRRRHKAVRGVLLTGRLSVEEMDRREIGYLRREVRVTCQRGQRLTGKIVRASVYIGSPNHLRRGSREFPIWRSYLDCVLAGYYELGGRRAVAEFIASTEGWDVPILDDRKKPKYPRRSGASASALRIIDASMAEHGLPRHLLAA